MTTRRDLVKYGALAAAASPFVPATRAGARAPRRPADGKLLFVIAATGGASIMDSFLPALRHAQTPEPLNAYAEGELDQFGGFRCPKDVEFVVGVPVGPRYSMIDFLRRHAADTAVVTQELTSVNHLIAAERSLNGNNANATRTIMEAVAARHGEGQLFANVNMAIAGYAGEGRDPNLPSFARAVSVGDAQLFPLSTHGVKGVKGAPDAALVARARSVRGRLEAASPFARTFRAAPALRRYLAERNGIDQIEAAGLIDKLLLIDEARQGVPLSEYGLASSPDLEMLRGAFPSLGTDSFHAQAALAFLLAKYGVSTAVTIGMQDSILLSGTGDQSRLESLPLAFDFSHNNHRGSQNTMWRRLLQVADGLIGLLKTSGLWERSLVYVATEFGRSKRTQFEESRGSGHDLNNGNLIISPLIRGGRVYGGIDDMTGLTYGFDPRTGEPERGRKMAEKDVYSLLAQAMDVEFAGMTDMSGVTRRRG